jgi:hypothetical protein
VPGAQVCAYDVDWFFIWSSTQLMGCATTDLTGTFEIRVRWCCGWWPWWWWQLRNWRLNPILSERVGELLARNSALRLGPIAGQQPSLSVFRPLANVGGLGALDRVLAADVGVLDRLREQLVARLPAAPELLRRALGARRVTGDRRSPRACRSRGRALTQQTVRWRTFRYVGETALTVTGGVTGARYYFGRPGAVVPVDARDRRSIAAVPVVRQVPRPA